MATKLHVIQRLGWYLLCFSVSEVLLPCGVVNIGTVQSVGSLILRISQFI